MSTVQQCSFACFHTEVCSVYPRNPDKKVTLKLSECRNDVKYHLKTHNVGSGCQEREFKSASSDLILSEADLICRRVGIFMTDVTFTICPLHRYKLGVDFKQLRSCSHPSHVGNEKTFRGATVTQSKKILLDTGFLVPVGSGLCFKCYSSISKIVKDDPELDFNIHSTSTKENEDKDISINTDEAEQLDYSSYKFTKSARESFIYNEKLEYGNISQDSSQSTDNMSQTSSWSQQDLDMSLEDLNNVVRTIGKGNICPVKHRICTDIDVSASNKRAIKQKASSLIHGILDCFAPGQAEKIIKLCFKVFEIPAPIPYVKSYRKE